MTDTSNKSPLTETLNIGMTLEMDVILKGMAYERSEPGQPVYRQDIIRHLIETSKEYQKAKAALRGSHSLSNNGA